jgi:hypothetical protein
LEAAFNTLLVFAARLKERPMRRPKPDDYLSHLNDWLEFSENLV